MGLLSFRNEYCPMARACPTCVIGAGAALLVFSTTDRESFEKIPMWHQKIMDECGRNVAIALVENKIDLVADSQVSAYEVTLR